MSPNSRFIRSCRTAMSRNGSVQRISVMICPPFFRPLDPAGSSVCSSSVGLPVACRRALSRTPLLLLRGGVFVLRIDHLPFRSLPLRGAFRRTRGGGGRRLLVHVLGEAVRTLHKRLRGLLEHRLLLGFHR